MFFDSLKKELELRNLSPKTIKIYLYYNQNLIDYCGKDPRSVNESDIKDYINYLLNERAVSAATARLALNALKYYYVNIQKRRFHYLSGLNLPKRPQRLPVVLSKPEVVRLIGPVKTAKHKLTLALLY